MAKIKHGAPRISLQKSSQIRWHSLITFKRKVWYTCKGDPVIQTRDKTSLWLRVHKKIFRILKIYMEYLARYEFASVGNSLHLKKKVSIENTLKSALFIHESNREFLYNKEIQGQFLN